MFETITGTSEFAEYALPNYAQSSTMHDEDSAAAHVVFYPQKTIGDSIGWYIRQFGTFVHYLRHIPESSGSKPITEHSPEWKRQMRWYTPRSAVFALAFAVAIIALGVMIVKGSAVPTIVPSVGTGAVPESTTVSTPYIVFDGDDWAIYLTPSPLAIAQQEAGVSAQAPASSHFNLDNDATQQVAPEFTPSR
jgi:hypothetical protein